ncbi:MAG: NAD+ synthase [Deltaproteobacteria bacterium]|nr:NAD+ synthase [Deltaproteobacteria bacterium]
MKITLAQLNPTIGDIRGNLHKALEAFRRAAQAGSDLVVFSELFLSGYPARDLLERPDFLGRIEAALEQIRQASTGFSETGMLIGAPVRSGRVTGRGLHNAALLFHAGRLVFTQHKSLLPNYDVFDEARYFDPAEAVATVAFRGERLGIVICEDSWTDPELHRGRAYSLDPVARLAAQGATLLINLSASPYQAGKEGQRLGILRAHARTYRVPAIMVNQVGGNDELVFDGRSACMGVNAEPVAVLDAFCEQELTLEINAHSAGSADVFSPREGVADVHDALVLGLGDYVRKCGFERVLLGLSGGIDSALVCCLAAAALGPENVLAVLMPSRYSSTGSIDDSVALAHNLGVRHTTIPIMPVYDSFIATLAPEFAHSAPDTTEENIQARIRGTLLMSLSNKFGHLLLTTGNKSEMAVGYCTLYGDMCGGLAVICDVPKTMVYALARYINRDREIIPESILTKAPSAELRPDQTDQDSLPPYDVLDRILEGYIDRACSLSELLSMGFDPQTVRWVIGAVDRNEYKRRQAAPGLKVTSKAFGMGRRMAIAACYGQETVITDFANGNDA